MTEEFFGPTFEEAEESLVLPEGTYTFLVEEGKGAKGKNPDKALTEAGDGSDVYNYRLALKLRVVKAPATAQKCTNRVTFGRFPLLGQMSWQVRRLAQQAALDYIQSKFDVKHPDYDPAQRPKFSSSDDETWLKICEFYCTGSLTDDTGKTFESPSGGLVGKHVEISVGKPKINEQTKELDSGFMSPMKA